MAQQSLQQAARTALEVQDASNLSGVVHSLDDIVTNAIWPAARRQGKGTEYVNTHPIVCSACVSKYSHATAECEKIATGLTDETNGTGAL